MKPNNKQTMEVVEIEYSNIKLNVSGVYIPPEPMVMYYPDGSGYPGSSSEFDIHSIKVIDSDIDIYELLSDDIVSDIVDKVITKIEE